MSFLAPREVVSASESYRRSMCAFDWNDRSALDNDKICAVEHTLAALVCFILIITIPFGIASLRIAIFALWRFGKTIVKRADAGVASGIGNILWFVLCGWWLALGHLVSGALLCLTIIGIPLGLANFKLIPVSLMPLGREIVGVEEAWALGARRC
jgi:uncharacterized membrane protein YccF (DUF307 family)